MNGLDSTPRYRRITYRDANGKLAKYAGMIHVDDEGVVRGTRTDDAPGPRPKDGTTLTVLNLFYGRLADIIQVERQNPVYETWEVIP